MLKLTGLAVLVWVFIAVHPCFADDHAKVVGTWRPVSWVAEFQATGEREYPMGKNPTGNMIFTPEGRIMMVVTGEGRKTAATDQGRADLWRSMVAYTGMYRLEGDKYITKIDASWNHVWVGTEQVRFFRLDGDRLEVITAWMDAPLRPERGKVRVFVTWEKVK